MTTPTFPELDRIPRHTPKCEAIGDTTCHACFVLADYSAWRNDDEAFEVHPFNVTCTCPHCEAVWQAR